MPIQRILVVDDSRTVALFLTEALEEFGFDTVSAANASKSVTPALCCAVTSTLCERFPAVINSVG